MNKFDLYVVFHTTEEVETITIVPVLFWELVDGQYKPFVPVYSKQGELIAECAYSDYMKHNIRGHGHVLKFCHSSKLNEDIEHYTAWQTFSSGEHEREFYMPIDFGAP